MATDPIHDRLLAIVKRLPDAVEDWPWGSIHCKVAGKIFVGWDRGADGVMSMGFRTSLEQQSALVASDPRFSIAKYVGKYGGTDVRIGDRPDWDELEHLIVESYRLIAPRRLVARLDATAPTPRAKAKPAAKARPAAKAKPGRRARGGATPRPRRARSPARPTRARRPDRAGRCPTRR